MDDEGRPTRLWSRLLFQPRQHTVIEWRLGLAVIAIALILTWLIFWTFIPRLIADIAVGFITMVSSIIGFFSGGGGTEVAAPALTPVLTPEATALPSPSPSPSPSPFPR
jgi:hypothetical protein